MEKRLFQKDFYFEKKTTLYNSLPICGDNIHLI